MRTKQRKQKARRRRLTPKHCLQCGRELIGQKQRADGVCGTGCQTILETDPTPEQIRERCAEIQKRFNSRQELDRSGGLSRRAFEVPVVAIVED